MTAAPRAERHRTIRRHHGDEVEDDYEWLRDKDSPATLTHLEAENAYTDAMTAHLAPECDAIYEQILSRVQETDMSVPVRHGDWWYYARVTAGAQYGVHARVRVADRTDWTPPDFGEEAPEGEVVLIDSNREADGHEFFSLGAVAVSDDHSHLAWSCDTTGDERYDLRIRRLSDGQDLPDLIAGIGGGATWSADGAYVFYTRVDDAWRPHEVWRHEIGSSAPDVRVFHEPDERFFVGVGRTDSEQYLVISIGSKITTEQWVLDAHDPTGEFRVVWPRVDGVEYAANHVRIGERDHAVIVHNRAHPNAELAIAPWDDPTAVHTLVPGADAVRLEDVEVTHSHLLVSLRHDALPRVGYMPVTDDGIGPLTLIGGDSDLCSHALAGGEFTAPLVRLGVGSFIRPARVFDVDLTTGERFLRKEAQVRGAFDPDDYVQERLWATAPDGERIPISLVRRVDTPNDASAPALLHGYGAYEASIDPGFSIPRLSLLDRGFVVAFAHVRGGGEMGRQWYESGKGLSKITSFTDFIACAEHLVATGWTRPDRLVAEGGSAGGLLMGAVTNMAPELFAGVLADVPFVDPLTSILDPSLPLTVIEWDEWGNPLEDPEAYAYIKSYSPYENVAAVRHPSILAVTSLHDTRVLYVEPAKWVARLRERSIGGGPVLLRTEMSAGHGGVSGRYAAWHERAWELAWIVDVATGGQLSPRIT